MNDPIQSSDLSVGASNHHFERSAGECEACTASRKAGANFCPVCGHHLIAPEPSIHESVLPIEPESSPKPLQSTSQVTTQPIALGTEEAPMPQVEVPTPVTATRCHCGQELPAQARFCLNCGNRLGEGQPEFQLVSVTPEGAQEPAYTLDDELTIGKVDQCDITLPDDEFISRRHARVCCDDGLMFLEDLGSSNGTFLRVRRPISLEVGDEILVGKTVLRLERR